MTTVSVKNFGKGNTPKSVTKISDFVMGLCLTASPFIITSPLNESAQKWTLWALLVVGSLTKFIGKFWGENFENVIPVEEEMKSGEV